MAIAFAARGGTVSNATAGTTAAVTVTASAGDCIIVAVGTVSSLPTSVTDNATGSSNIYYMVAGPATNTDLCTMWICPSSKSSVTTVTVHFSSQRYGVAVSTYTGVLGFGQVNNSTTGTSAAPTASLAAALQANNWQVAAMVDVGTSAWAATTGNLENHVAGAGATTPGAAVMDNTTNTTTASITSAAWGTCAIELWASNIPLLTDQNIDYYNQAALPPWRAGNLKLYAEDEQFSWGYLFDTKMSIDNERFDQPPKLISFVAPEIETEQFDWGYAVPLSGVGSQSMGYSGHWALKPAMGSEYETFDYSSPEVITREDMYIDVWSWQMFTEEDNEGEQFGFKPPPPAAITPFGEDQNPVSPQSSIQWNDDDASQSPFFALEQFGEVQEYGPARQQSIIPEMETEQFEWSLNATELAGSGANLMGFRGFWSLRAAMGTDTEFDTSQSGFFALEQYADADEQFYPVVAATFQEDDPVVPLPGVAALPNMLYDFDYNVAQQTSQLLNQDEYDWGYAVPLMGVGSQMMGYSGFWVSKPAMGSEIDAWSFNPPVPAAISPFADAVNPLVLPLQFQETDSEQFGVGVPTARKSNEEDYTPFIKLPVLQWADDDASQSSFFALEQFGEVQEYGPAQQQSYFNRELNSDFDIAQSSFFALEQYGDVDEQSLSRVWMIADDVDQQNFVEVFVQDDQPQPLDVRRMAQEDEPMLLLVGVAPLPNMLYDADFNPAQQLSQFFNDQDTEEFDWGYAVPLAGIGSQMMGYSGFWVSKPAMGTIDDWSFNPPVPTSISPFDEDGGIPLLALVIADDDSFGQQPIFVQEETQGPILVSATVQDTDSDQLTPEGFAADRVPEDYEQWIVSNQLAVQWTDEDTSQSSFFALEQYGEVQEYGPARQASIVPEIENEIEQVYPAPPFLTPIGFDDAPEQVAKPWIMFDDAETFGYLVSQSYADADEQTVYQRQWLGLEDEPMLLLVGVAPLPNMLYDADFNATMQMTQMFGLEDPDWGYKPPTLATYQEDCVYQDRPQLQSLTPEIETEQFDWGYNVPLAGIGSQMQGYSGFWVSKPAMGSEVDAWGYNPVAVVAAITPFADEHTPLALTLQYQDVEDAAFNPVIVGTGGTQLMGFRGFRDYKAAMQPDEQWSFNAPVVTVITPFDFDQQPLQASMIVAEVEEIDINPSAFYAPAIFDPGDEFQPLAQALAVQTEDEQVYPRPPFLTPIGFDDSPEQIAKPWVMYDDVETFGYQVSQTFAEPQEFGPAQQRTFVPEIEDESAQVYPNPPFITAMPFDDSPEQLPNITVVMDIDHTLFVYGVLVGPLPSMPFDADFNPTMMRGFYFTSPEDEQFNWGYKPPTVATYQEDGVYQDRMMQSITPELETEQFDWGFDRSRYYALGDEAPYFTSLWQMMPTLDDDTNWGFKPPAPVAISGFDQDELPPNKPQAITDDVMDSSYNPVIVGTGGTQMMGFRGQWAAKAAMGSDYQDWSFQPPVPPVADAWELSGFPPTPPFLYQDDVDVTGFQRPIAYPGFGQDDEQAPHFPFWNLDWAEGWEVLPGITNRPIRVMIVYKVEDKPLLSLQVASTSLLLRVGQTSCSNIISVQGITVQ